MPLDTQTSVILKRLKAIDFSLTRDMTPEQARYRQRALTRMAAPGEPVDSIKDISIPGRIEGGTPLRIYTPEGDGPFPILIYFHGGGGVIGDLDTEDGLCRQLVNLAGCLVVSVAYHLAPEYKFPSGPYECYAAVQWIATHAASFNGDASRLAIGGMSAGGNLAAVVTHMTRDQGGPHFVFQLLLTPLTDFRLLETPSLEHYAEGYFLTREDILWFMQHCLNGEEDRKNPLASPTLASSFSGLPPTLIITAEYDPLRDDGEHYGQLLKDAGTSVTILRSQGAIHGFVAPDPMHEALSRSASALRFAFQSGSGQNISF